MNAELLAMLGGQMPSASSRNREPEGKVILTFKAGKMKTELQPTGKYLVTPDNRRGSIQIVWQAQPASGGSGASGSGGGGGVGGVLKFEWKDRRTRSVVDSLSIFPEDEVTYSKVPTGRDGDRVYLLQYGRASDRRFFFWMQDKDKEGGPEKDAETDEEHCVKINTFLSDVDSAKKAAEEAGGTEGAASAGGGGAAVDTSALGGGAGGTLDNAALMQIMQGLGGSGAGAGAATSGSRPSAGSAGSGSGSGGAVQADALSNILQNLNAGSSAGGGGSGAPSNSDRAESGGESGGSGSGTEESGSASTPVPAASSAGGGTLTLADLQGAMAGLATASPPHSATAAASNAEREEEEKEGTDGENSEGKEGTKEEAKEESKDDKDGDGDAKMDE